MFIDGLGKREEHHVGPALRHQGVVVRKTRGLADESDEFIRLADALAGFVRQYLERRGDVLELYRHAVKSGVLAEL